ncbi:MAG: amidohydrolase [Saprospiraceae bacterium]|nr:amidohydrolase [Saprospiraceae bacterium]
MKGQFICCLLIFPIVMSAQMNAEKESVLQSVESHKAALIELSDQIWAFAETALREHQSSKVLADYAEEQGFRVERGVAGMPTAFIASFGSGKPVIGILGEYDALPGISQKASPVKEPLKEGAAGHGCGHNLFGAASLGAAIAIKELIERGELKGTIRFYGTPAEESVGGKIYMVRDGLFSDLDACIDWHPDAKTKANTQSSQALIDLGVEFYGKAAHAAYDPWNGRSALDAVESFISGVNLYREHIRPTSRLHYIIQSGGDVPNVIPEYAKVWIWARDSKRSIVDELQQRIRKIAAGAALMNEVDYRVSLNAGDHELLVNRTGAYVLHQNLSILGPIEYSASELDFAKRIQSATGKESLGIDGQVQPFEETREHPEGGSTDVGDVSWNVPQISLLVTTAPTGTPWHSWPVVACGGMSIGHKGLVYAAKAMALTMVDLYQDDQILKDMRTEFLEKKGNYQYKAMIPEGPPPMPNQ